MGENLAEDPEKEKFFLGLARDCGRTNRMDYSMCYKGFGCKVIPDPNNSHKWTIEFDTIEKKTNG